MIGRAELNAAIAARLSDIPEEIAKEAAGAIYGDTRQPPREIAPAVILERLGVPATRNPSAVWHALLALGAEIAGDAEVYFPAAFNVFEAHRQAERARQRQGGDGLDAEIREILAEHPRITTPWLWAWIARRASSGGFFFGPNDDVTKQLIFSPSTGVFQIGKNIRVIDSGGADYRPSGHQVIGRRHGRTHLHSAATRQHRLGADQRGFCGVLDSRRAKSAWRS